MRSTKRLAYSFRFLFLCDFHSSRSFDVSSASTLRMQFQKILVINLPSRTDCRDAMSLSAVVSNLQLDWIDGFSGDDVLEKAPPPGDHKFISPGSKGS